MGRLLCVADEGDSGRGDREGEEQMRESRGKVEPAIIVVNNKNKISKMDFGVHNSIWEYHVNVIEKSYELPPKLLHHSFKHNLNSKNIY